LKTPGVAVSQVTSRGWGPELMPVVVVWKDCSTQHMSLAEVGGQSRCLLLLSGRTPSTSTLCQGKILNAMAGGAWSKTQKTQKTHRISSENPQNLLNPPEVPFPPQEVGFRSVRVQLNTPTPGQDLPVRYSSIHTSLQKCDQSRIVSAGGEGVGGGAKGCATNSSPPGAVPSLPPGPLLHRAPSRSR